MKEELSNQEEVKTEEIIQANTLVNNKARKED